eukprot:scaffold21019_cov18-Prasinocladus_malaysianus.AAC.1
MGCKWLTDKAGEAVKRVAAASMVKEQSSERNCKWNKPFPWDCTSSTTSIMCSTASNICEWVLAYLN